MTYVLDNSHKVIQDHTISWSSSQQIVANYVSMFYCLWRDLWPEYEYTASLYHGVGAINADKNPTFFVKMSYNNEVKDIYQDVHYIL